jgi:hypothetical protein
MPLPVLQPHLAGTGVGIRGGSVKDTASSVAPEIGVYIESGSPVDAMPVGVTVRETSLSSMPDPAQAVMKPIRDSIWMQRKLSVWSHGQEIERRK